MNALLSEDHALTLVEQRFNKVIFGDKKSFIGELVR